MNFVSEAKSHVIQDDDRVDAIQLQPFRARKRVLVWEATSQRPGIARIPQMGLVSQLLMFGADKGNIHHLRLVFPEGP